MSQNDRVNLSETEEEPKDDQKNNDVKMVPVTESIRYRKRAQSAEKKCEQLANEMKSFKEQKQNLQKEVESLKFESDVMKKLSQAGAIDMESAVLVTKERLKESDDADIDGVIEDLKKNKGFIFGSSDQKVKAAGKTAFARDKINPGSRNSLGKAAKKALASGSRIDLHEYMKLKRGLL